jgi:hypothetical protein
MFDFSKLFRCLGFTGGARDPIAFLIFGHLLICERRTEKKKENDNNRKEGFY